MTERFRVVPAAYVILRRGDEVLLQLRQNTGYRDGYWAAAAAGHVEAEESVFEAAVREAPRRSASTRPLRLVPLCAMHRTHGNHRPIDERVDFFFECRRGRANHASSSRRRPPTYWSPLARLPDNVVPHERAVARAARRRRGAAVVTYGF